MTGAFATADALVVSPVSTGRLLKLYESRFSVMIDCACSSASNCVSLSALRGPWSSGLANDCIRYSSCELNVTFGDKSSPVVNVCLPRRSLLLSWISRLV